MSPSPPRVKLTSNCHFILMCPQSFTPQPALTRLPPSPAWLKPTCTQSIKAKVSKGPPSTGTACTLSHLILKAPGAHEGPEPRWGLGLAVLPEGSVSGPWHHRKETRRLWAFRKLSSASVWAGCYWFRVVLNLKGNS